ncbi:8041_t:CDS:2, partial [Scutellospora calospora]
PTEQECWKNSRKTRYPDGIIGYQSEIDDRKRVGNFDSPTEQVVYQSDYRKRIGNFDSPTERVGYQVKR